MQIHEKLNTKRALLEYAATTSLPRTCLLKNIHGRAYHQDFEQLIRIQCVTAADTQRLINLTNKSHVN